MENQGGRGRGNRRRPFNRGRGGGRGHRSNNSAKNNPKKPHVNKEIKFHLHGAGKDKQSCSYSKVLEKICQRFQQNLTNSSNIVKSIKEDEITRPKKPTRAESTEVDKDKKAFE